MRLISMITLIVSTQAVLANPPSVNIPEPYLRERIAEVCDRIDELNTGKRLLSAEPLPWTKGTHAEGRKDVPAGDQDYEFLKSHAMQGYNEQLSSYNAVLSEMGKTPVTCQ